MITKNDFKGCCSICKKELLEGEESYLLTDRTNKKFLVCSKKCGFEQYNLLRYDLIEDSRALDWLLEVNFNDLEKEVKK